MPYSPPPELVTKAFDLMSGALKRMAADKFANPENMFAGAHHALLVEYPHVALAVIRAAVDAAFLQMCRSGRVECRGSAAHRTVRKIHRAEKRPDSG